MIFLQSFLYYTVFSSVVLVYGIGLNRIAEFGISKRDDSIFIIKVVLSIFVSAIISWVIIQYILIPLKMIELYPLLAFLVFSSINVLLEAMVRIITNKSYSEFIVSFLIVLLSLTESTSLVNTLIICASGVISVTVIIPFCLAFKARFTANGNKINERYYSIFFIFVAILILMMSAWDIIWLNPGVMQ